MKTIEEKAKAYDEAIRKLRVMMPNWERLSYNGKTFLQDLIYIFPELKESEDEKVRKNCIHFLELQKSHHAATFEIDECIAWLEKQESEPNRCHHKVDLSNCSEEYRKAYYDGYNKCNRDWIHSQEEQKASYTTIVETGDGGINALVARELPTDGEQKPANKVESNFTNFKIGDWIVENGVNRNPVQITSFEEDKGVGIKVWFSNDTGTYVDFLKGYHKWTIQDAKEGDVLISKYRSMCIFKDNKSCYCYIDTEHKNFYAKNNRWFSTDYTLKPATKEQRDLLFQKMKEAGYEWDDGTKELKKIAEEFQLKEGNFYECIKSYHYLGGGQYWFDKGKVYFCERDGYLRSDPNNNIYVYDCKNWQSYFRPYTKKTAEWSEEDDKVRTTIINEFEQCSEWCCANGLTKEDCIDWLQSLKGRVQPKQDQGL